jgi:hypothetical protein
MSTSTMTVEEVGSGQLGDILQAYKLHHSGASEEQPLPQQPASRSPSHNNRIQPPRDERSSNEDPNSISSRRRVPAYRETSRNHSLASRPGGVDSASEFMVPAMFFGVFVQMVSVVVAKSDPDSEY